MYEVRNISFSYDSKETLRDVSFVVSPGEAVAVIGANGAGKTTLLKVLANLAVPSSGVILHDGQNITGNLDRYRRQLGYLPEKVALYDDMKVRDYLSYRAVIKGEMPRRVRRRVEEALEMCRLRDCAKSRIGVLSYGFKKRVALADALLLRPRVLVLDDLLSGLDEMMRSSLGEIVREAAAFSSVVVTGHEIADLAEIASSFLVLSGGVISSSIPTAGMTHAEIVERVKAALKEGGR
jgi:ABC-2 type transport system ATP-binding protein